MPPRDVMMGYGVAVLATAFATLLSLLFRPLFVDSPSALLFGAVAISARFHGRGPGLLATVLAGAAFIYVTFYPPVAFSATFPMSLVALVEFVVICLLLTYLSDSLRAALRRVQTNLSLLDTLLASAPVGMGFLDRQFRVVRMNDVLARQDTTTGPDAIGRPTRELVPGLWSAIEPLLYRVLATGEPVVNQEVSGEVPASPGELRAFLVSYYPVRGVSSEIQGIGSVIVDITARKRLEDERVQLLDRARAAEARYRALFENLADPVFVADTDARHVDANHAATELLGYSREELLGKTLEEVMDPGSGWTKRERARLVRAGRWRGDLELCHRDGSRVPVEARSMAVALPAGTMYVTVARDLTERRRAEDVRLRLTREEAIRATVERERARLWAILDHAPAGISYLDATTHQLLTNTRAKDLFGLPPTADLSPEAIVSQLRTPDGRLPSREDLPTWRALRGETTSDQELMILRPGGRQVPILVSAAPIHGVTGQIEGVVVVFQDIANLKDLERVREEFMGAVAHELRSPIAVIRGHAQLALLRDASEDSARQAFASIIPQTDRIAHTIDDLLLVQSLRPGPRGLTTERLDLAAAIRVVLARAAKGRPGYSFRVTDGGPLEVVADPSLVDLLLTRLLENALRYSPREGPIEVDIRREGSDAVVSIQDHGVGIPLDRQAHVFAPFYEPVPAGASGYVGVVSLDLYLSKQIIEAHEGRIWFTSLPEQGSTFSFTLPLATTEG